jgi:iron complex transport system substrate-binding protein
VEEVFMHSRKLVGVLAGLALFAGACGGDDAGSPAPDTTEDAAAPETTDAAPPATERPDDVAETNGEFPSRIISLSPTHTEMLFAIGAGDQVIAVDAFSNYPPEAAAKATDLSGFEPNVEAIAGYEPDLVVTEGTRPDLVDQLESLGITTWQGPAVASFSEVFEQIEQLGAATGRVAEAAEVVAEMQAEIDEITAGLPETSRPFTYYHELDPTYFSVTSDTFIGYVYGQLGLRSIADLAEGSGGQYPQLNAEFIISSNPDLIFQACTKYCGETAASMAARPGWDAISAAADGLIFEMDDDVASRWGPRIVDYYRTVAEAVGAVVERQASS